MACVQNPVQDDSEREEGEIVDELDDLSDISSEEEFLLRQRLHMLEKYNNVLERKNAKRTTVKSSVPGKKERNHDPFLCDLSEISATEFEEPYVLSRDSKEQKHFKSYHKPKRRNDPPLVERVHRKKSNKIKKRVTALSESSDESDDEYRNKRRKLAVAVNKSNVDNTSLKARLAKLLGGSQNTESERFFPNTQNEDHLVMLNNEVSLEKINISEAMNGVENDEKNEVFESVDLCSDIETKESGNIENIINLTQSNKIKKRVTALSESSDESDDEYRNKRRKLAVAVNKSNVDNTSLKARLAKLLGGSQNTESERFFPNTQNEDHLVMLNNEVSLEKINISEAMNGVENDEKNEVFESVDLCSDIETKESGNIENIINLTQGTKNNGSIERAPPESQDTVDSPLEPLAKGGNVIIPETQNTKDSDEDLELLREHALKTKTLKTTSKKVESDKQIIEQSDIVYEKGALMLSGDEDSDTAELRLICLKSALLKKAFERKQKQKLRKRLSQSLNLNDELMRDQIEYMNQMLSDNNNTDIESVDMDIGSDGDEKSKDSLIESIKPTNAEYETLNATEMNKNKEDDFEEDEDLLRAKLLTSLSKNLPNLVHPNDIAVMSESKPSKKDNETEKQANNIPEEKRFIISVGNSDSEGEHEATKNLTKMHIKLSEQADFQQKLDMFLKSTRMEVEKSVLPDVVQQPLPKTKEKFVPKTVNHLPKSEQIEYKILVKRMAELEKIKKARQSSIINNKETTQPKETLKPRNYGPREQSLNNDLEEQIALSRKTIAEESAKVLKLKEEATKLSHKYKIVSTELRNIATAITLNKKQQKVAQIKLSKIRTQHQLLINSSTSSKHSMPNGHLGVNARCPQKLPTAVKRPQKENAPAKEEVKTVQLYNHATLSNLQSFKVSFVNDRMEEPNPRLSVQIDVTNNKKTVKLPKSPVKNSFTENNLESRITDGRSIDITKSIDKGKRDDKEQTDSNWGSKNKLTDDDYKSPLTALGSANWDDPNAVLCRFEVGGHCKDPDCKYLHPKKQQ